MSLEGVYRVSSFAVTGEVVGAELGFFGGTPSTLLEIEVERRVLPRESDWKGTQLFVSYPEAQIPLAGGLFCGRRDRGGVAPAMGSRVLVFTFRSVDPDRYPVLDPMDNEIFFETEDGDLSVPVLGPGHPQSWEQLERRLERLQGGALTRQRRQPIL